MTSIYSQISHNSGIPLGGIGTGTVEIRPDGLFHDWQMFNCGQWNPGSPCCVAGKIAMKPEDLLFLVRTRTSDGHVLARYLALREELHDLYSLAWLRCVEAISFEGTFPLAHLTYIDPALPVSIEAELFSPFIPLDSRISGTPGFYVHFTARNLTDQPVDVSIMGIMKNPVGYDQDSCSPRNALAEIGALDGATAIHLTAENLAEGQCSTGDMTFCASGGDVSYVTGSTREEHKALVFYKNQQEAGLKRVTFLHQFRDDGELPNLNAEAPMVLPQDFSAAALSEQERKRLLNQLLNYAWVYDKYQSYALVDPAIVDSPDFLDEIAQGLRELEERKMDWGWAALCSRSTLGPQAEGAALFAVSWYFPNHISPSGANIGHAYENWLGNSLDAAQILLADFSHLRAQTLALPDAIHTSSLPEEAADAITGQITTLTKCTWWTREGHFGIWEGLGCCGFHTTDITYQGSFPIISLFPDLQKVQMEHGAAFQRDDGRVHHFFTPDFSAVDNGFDRVDMNQQFVMLAARDYLWSGDRGYLERLWPHIIRAMDNTAQLDTDGDGLPDTDTRRNTYDAWNFSGCPSYIASLWLGALKAAVRLANEMGDDTRAVQWQAAYDKGVASFDEKLWNGEYYVLWRDGDQLDECCMSDQMSGDWFAAVSGWSTILTPDRITAALEAIMRYNFRESEGLLNATYPPGKPRRLAASGNFQADAPWTGIEYTVAALLISNGMLSEGLAIVRDIDNRYLRAGRVWSHVECGGHYYRAMSSWTLLIALSGFAWDQPAGLLTFAPVLDEQVSEYPFFTPLAWGRYYQERGLAGRAVRIEIEAGAMQVQALSLPKLTGFEEALVAVADDIVACSVSKCCEGIRILLDEPVTLAPDIPLVITG